MPLLLEFIPETFIPLFIFLARIIDVSMGTLRIMLVSRGMKIRATLLGFFEVLIWIVIVAQIFQNLDNLFNLVAYAAGFAAGIFVGMVIEEKMQMGTQLFRIVTHKPAGELIEKLREADFRVTCLNAEGRSGSVRVIFTIARRKRWKELAALVRRHAPESFYSVEDIKYTSDTRSDHPDTLGLWTRMLRLRKGL